MSILSQLQAGIAPAPKINPASAPAVVQAKPSVLSKFGAASPAAPAPNPAPLVSPVHGIHTVNKAPSAFFMKTGLAAIQALEQEEAKAAMYAEEKDKLWRFRMKEGTERKITFLDGDLGPDGLIAADVYYEHSIQLNGKWENFVCTQGNEPCPICNAGDNKGPLVACLTILDHTPHKIVSGPNQGKVIQDQKQLFIMKRRTIILLTKQAVKHGGLRGCTYEVTRSTDKDPAVGNQFDFVEKLTYAQIAGKYQLKPDYVAPADYGKEITYRTAEELIALGAGKAPTGPGYANNGSHHIDKSKVASQL